MLTKTKARNNYPNVYKLYLDSLYNYLNATQPLTVESCLYNMERVIDSMGNFRPSEMPPNFMDDCDDLYHSILKHRKKLTAEQIERLNKLNERRKALFHGNTRAVSYWRNIYNAVLNKQS